MGSVRLRRAAWPCALTEQLIHFVVAPSAIRHVPVPAGDERIFSFTEESDR